MNTSLNNSQKLYLHIVIDLFPFQPSIVLCQNFLPDPAEENLQGYLYIAHVCLAWWLPMGNMGRIGTK